MFSDSWIPKLRQQNSMQPNKSASQTSNIYKEERYSPINLAKQSPIQVAGISKTWKNQGYIQIPLSLVA